MQPLIIKSAHSARTLPNASPLLGVHLIPLPDAQGSVFAIATGTARHTSWFPTAWSIIAEHLEMYAREFPEGGNIPRRFEQMLQSLNAALVDSLGEQDRFPKHALHAIVGVLSQTQVFTSGIGNLHALFLHKTTKQRYTIYELDTQFRTDGAEDPKIPFVTVLDGELHPGDIFYVATRLPARELDTAGLQDILVTLPPASALSRIEQHAGFDAAYGGICFQVAVEENDGLLKKENPIVSIEHLGETKEETAMILGEEQPSLAKWIANKSEPLLKHLSAPGMAGSASFLRRSARLVLKYLTVITVTIITAGAYLWRILRTGLQRSRTFIQETIQDKKARETWKQRLAERWRVIRALPLSVKLSVIGTCIVLIGGTTGIFLWRTHAKTVAAENRFQELVREIDEKQEAADASLIYNNKEQARQLLAQAEALFKNLPDAPGHDAETSRLRTALDASFAQVQGVTPITPSRLATLADAVPGASWTETTTVNGVIYGVTDTIALTAFPSLENTLSVISTTNGTVGRILHMSAEGNTILFIDDARHLGAISLSAKTINPLVSGADKLPSIEDIGWYNGNVYLLSANAGQIVKMRPQGSGYEAGTPWVTSSTSSLADARALAIDGDVYVLTKNGIIKFSSGKEQPFTLGGFDPAFQNPTDIWTSLASSYLYILDPDAKRVVILNKKGEFITQYMSNDLAGTFRIFVDEEKKIITATSPSAILSFPATHLQ